MLLAAGVDIGKTVLITGRSWELREYPPSCSRERGWNVVATSQPRRRIFKSNRIYGVFYSAERILAILAALGDAL